MECPICGAELEYDDSYGNRDYICHDDIIGKSGDIYRCPNSEEFETEQEALKYAKDNNIESTEYDDWEDRKSTR